MRLQLAAGRNLPGELSIHFPESREPSARHRAGNGQQAGQLHVYEAIHVATTGRLLKMAEPGSWRFYRYRWQSMVPFISIGFTRSRCFF